MVNKSENHFTDGRASWTVFIQMQGKESSLLEGKSLEVIWASMKRLLEWLQERRNLFFQ